MSQKREAPLKEKRRFPKYLYVRYSHAGYYSAHKTAEKLLSMNEKDVFGIYKLVKSQKIEATIKVIKR